MLEENPDTPWLKLNKDLIPPSVDDAIVMDFRNFMYIAMKALGLGEPTQLQYAMGYRLQHGPESFQLQAGRGAGKSVLTALFATWLLLRDPDTVIMVLSATGNKPIEFISMCRNTIALLPECAHLRPGPSTKDSAFGFNVEARQKKGQDLSVFAKGIKSQITGSHADWVILDDVEIENNSATAEAREKLLNRVWEIEQIRNVGGGIRILGTPQSSESIYKKLREAYPCYKFPALVPDPDIPGQIEDADSYILELMDEGLEVGEATQPERFDNNVLAERRLKVGPTLFSLHYHLDTSLADAAKFPLRLSDLILVDLDKEEHPEKVVWSSKPSRYAPPSYGLQGDLFIEPMYVSDKYQPYKYTCMHIDPSGRGSDETAIIIASVGNGYVFVHELLGLAGGYEEEVLVKIAKLCLEYPNIKLIRYEENFGDGMFGNLLRPVIGKYLGHNIAVEGYRVSGMKEERIIKTLEPVMNSHRLVFKPSAIKDQETQRQITRITNTRGALKHDDRVDVLAAAVLYYEEFLGIDVDTAVEKAAQAEIDNIWKMMKDDSKRGIWLLGDRVSGAVRNADPKFRKVATKGNYNPIEDIFRKFGR